MSLRTALFAIVTILVASGIAAKSYRAGYDAGHADCVAASPPGEQVATANEVLYTARECRACWLAIEDVRERLAETGARQDSLAALGAYMDDVAVRRDANSSQVGSP